MKYLGDKLQNAWLLFERQKARAFVRKYSFFETLRVHCRRQTHLLTSHSVHKRYARAHKIIVYREKL